MVIFTIVSRNYFAFALTLMESTQQFYKNSVRYIIIADQHAENLECGSVDARVVGCQQLFGTELESMAFAYSILEFNTALKARCFSWIFEKHPGECCLYLDPDIWLLAPLNSIEAAFDNGAELLLTPHITTSRLTPWAPDDLRLLRDGVYNLGFCGLKDTPATRDLLKWWESHLLRDCRTASDEGIFVDQKWMELAPCFIENTVILRDPGLNIAYWNLPERNIERDEKQYKANGRPVGFVHFSGIRALDPVQFCKYYPELSGDELQPAVRELFNMYIGELRKNGHLRYAKEPYGFSFYRDGSKVCEGHRIYYRNRLRDIIDGSPFDLGAAYFNQPDEKYVNGGEPFLPRGLIGVWWKWPELRHRFTLDSPEGRSSFWQWVLEYGVKQEDIAPIENVDLERFGVRTAGIGVSDREMSGSVFSEDSNAGDANPLTEKLHALEKELDAMRASRSWRFTRPLRWLKSRLSDRL